MIRLNRPPSSPIRKFPLLRWLPAAILAGAWAMPASAQWVEVVSEGFEANTAAATGLDDTGDFDPAAPVQVTDDDPAGGVAGSGVQVAGWDAKTGERSLLVRSNSQAVLHLHKPMSGNRYQVDFHINSVVGEGDRNFYVILRSMGLDNNGDDFLAYRADRGFSPTLNYWQGILTDEVGAAAWFAVDGVDRTEGGWQHHRFVIDMTTQSYDLYLDDMDTPALTGLMLSRPGAPVPTAIILRHEGDSEDDGYFLIDDISVQVEGSRDLSTPFTESFEGYEAMDSFLDDADPAAPWVVSEVAGSGNGNAIDHSKAQVVDSSVVPAHTGDKSLKLEGGQQCGVTYAWGSGPEEDVEITWWARVPESIAGDTANYLRMSLYGVEGGRSDQGDCALLGYGSRDSAVGDETSLTVYTGGWRDTEIDYTPDTWEEYRLTTHNAEGTYTIVKGPSSATPEIVADRLSYIGADANWGPVFMVAWSSSNGSGHPPVYIDDIEVKSVSSGPVTPPVVPYQPVASAGRFTESTVVRMPGPVGMAAVDPRDPTTIVAAIDSTNGALYQLNKSEAGEWVLDEMPLITGLSNPSGLIIDNEGTIWWTHDFTQSVRRLKAPWRDNTQETVIASFDDAGADDDPISLVQTGPEFNGTIGKPGWIVVAERDWDGQGLRALYQFDPATIEPGQVGWADFLVEPTTDLGSSSLNDIAYLPSSAELVISNRDGSLAVANANGIVRPLIPDTAFGDPAGVSVDPASGRVWVADRNTAEIWSLSATDGGPPDDKLEVTFTLTDPDKPETQIRFNDPGISFSPDGTMLLVGDSSLENRGGWLTILTGPGGEPPTPVTGPVTITSLSHSAAGFAMAWEPQENVTYRVLRSATPDQSFVDISGVLTTPSFTDTAPPDARAFYRISVVPNP